MAGRMSRPAEGAEMMRGPDCAHPIERMPRENSTSAMMETAARIVGKAASSSANQLALQVRIRHVFLERPESGAPPRGMPPVHISVQLLNRNNSRLGARLLHRIACERHILRALDCTPAGLTSAHPRQSALASGHPPALTCPLSSGCIDQTNVLVKSIPVARDSLARGKLMLQNANEMPPIVCGIQVFCSTNTYCLSF